jgi:hypothetical protein
VLIAVLAGALLTACSPESPTALSESPGDRPSASQSGAPESLEPTLDDGLSPSYKPDAPVRSVVGTGHVLTGTVVSSRDGSPIAGAKFELWPEYPDRGHLDAARATVFTDPSGRYRFECDPPEHIHMRITAPGYVGIAQNSYHPEGRPEGTFDVVLRPE